MRYGALVGIRHDGSHTAIESGELPAMIELADKQPAYGSVNKDFSRIEVHEFRKRIRLIHYISPSEDAARKRFNAAESAKATKANEETETKPAKARK